MKLFTVDAFTDRPFAGNPAAVCMVDDERNASWMQNVAAEMNLSETAFLQRRDDGYQMRWFTPKFEVDLCGHATLASAHVLWTEMENTGPSIQFQTRSGVLTASRKDAFIELNFPATPPDESDAPDGLMEALGVEASFVGASKFDKFLVVASEEIVRSLKPDFQRLGQVDTRGVIVTSTSEDPKFDFISRFFAPRAGINEDPVTGSAHCCLAPYWAKRLGKNELTGFQASPRGGVVRVKLTGDRVLLAGQAVTVVRGELL